MIGLTLEKLDDFETEELARGIFDIPDDSEIDEVLYEQFGIDFEQWAKIINTLIIYTPIVISELTKTKYHAFIKDGIALAKIKYVERGE